jgi:acetyltransferase-like isoleucine patch superfamily enzyme
MTTFFTSFPGAAGFLLRHIFYPSIFGKVGSGVHFGRGITLRRPSQITIGKGCILDDYCVLDCKTEFDPGIIIGDECSIGRASRLSTGYTGKVEIGDKSQVGDNCSLHGPGGIEIGKNVLIGDYTVLNAGKHEYADPEKPVISQVITIEGIKIGSGSWIGTGVIITDGVTIGEGCVINAGSVVDSSIPDYSVAGGVPAKVTGKRK